MNRLDNETKLKIAKQERKAKLKVSERDNETKLKLASIDEKNGNKRIITEVSKEALIATGKIAGGIMMKEMLTKYLITEFTGAKPATWAATKLGERVFTNYMNRMII